MEKNRTAILTDQLLAAGLLALAVAMALMAMNYRRGAELFPLLVAGVLGLCAVTTFARTLRGRSHSREVSQVGVEPVGALRLTGYVGALLAYAFLMPRVGFVTTTLVFVAGVSYAFGLRSTRWLVLGTILFTIGVQWLFRGVFNVQLPLDWFWRFF